MKWESKIILRLFLSLLLLLSVSFSAYSQDVNDMTDSELLDELTLILTDLESENEQLKNSLMTVLSKAGKLTAQLETLSTESKQKQTELAELKTSFQNYENARQAETFWTILISTGAGVLAGALTVALIK